MAMILENGHAQNREENTFCFLLLKGDSIDLSLKIKDGVYLEAKFDM